MVMMDFPGLELSAFLSTGELSTGREFIFEEKKVAYFIFRMCHVKTLKE